MVTSRSCLPEFETESRLVSMSDDGGVNDDGPGDSEELNVTGVNGVKSEEQGRSDNSMISIATTIVCYLMICNNLQYLDLLCCDTKRYKVIMPSHFIIGKL